MRRVIIFDNLDNYIGDLALADVMAMERHEEINGEHSLIITTTQVLTQGNRVVYEDERGIWREYVVTGVDEAHTAGKTVVGSYYCVWSLLVDMQGVIVSIMPGVQTPVTAWRALRTILEAQSRWSLGTVTQTSTGGASMYDMSAWQALGVLVDNWGGEISATIEVSPTAGIVSRSVNLYNQIGELEAKRRYDFGRDVAGVTRHFEDSAVYCRISPRGKGEQTEGGGYGRKIRITDVNDGKDYLEYAPMVDVAKLPDGNGGYQYPTLIVENSNCETPQELLDWSQGILADTLTPKVSYDVDAVQTGVEGVDISGVSLGDVVQVVDRYFNADGGLRITGRIVVMVIDEISSKNISVTIGDISESLATKFSDLQKQVDETTNNLNSFTGYLATAEYVNELIDRINADINATGQGYAYIVPGHGILTYDELGADPLNPVEATQVTQIGGGNVRIGSKNAQGQWEYRSVFINGHILADLVTAAKITTGFIGSAGGTYINLDQNIVNLGDETKSHVVVDDNGFYVYDGANLGVNIGGAKYVVGDTVLSGVFYSFGPRANTGENGLYSLSVGDNNFVGSDSPYCGAIGYHLYAPKSQRGGNGAGLAIGRYNVKSNDGDWAGKEIIQVLQNAESPAFVIGDGNVTLRKNSFEVDQHGNIGFRGTLYSESVGRIVDATFSGVSCTDPLRNTLVSFVLPSNMYARDSHYGLWLVYVRVRFSGVSTSNPIRGEVYISESSSGSTDVGRYNIYLLPECLMFVYKNTATTQRTLYLALGDLSSNTCTASGSVQAIQLI